MDLQASQIQSKGTQRGRASGVDKWERLEIIDNKRRKLALNDAQWLARKKKLKSVGVLMENEKLRKIR